MNINTNYFIKIDSMQRKMHRNTYRQVDIITVDISRFC